MKFRVDVHADWEQRRLALVCESIDVDSNPLGIKLT